MLTIRPDHSKAFSAINCSVNVLMPCAYSVFEGDLYLLQCNTFSYKQRRTSYSRCWARHNIYYNCHYISLLVFSTI